MANRTVALQIQLQNAKSIADLDAVLKEINKDLKVMDVESEAFAKMSDLAKKADGQLKSVREEIKGISDEKQLDSIAKLGGAIAASMSVATVAVSAFGAETDEEIQKAIQTATQLSVVVSSIKPIMEGLTSTNRKAFAQYVSGLGEVISGFRKSALGATLFGNATRAAMAATGIGALIVGLTLLITYWEDIAKAIGLAEERQDSFFKSSLKNLEVQQKAIVDYNDNLDVQIKLLQLAGDAEERIFDLRRKQLLLTLFNEEERQKVLGEQTNLLLKALQIEEGRLELTTLTQEEFSQLVKLQQESGKNITEMFKESKEQFDASSKAIVNLKNQLSILSAEEAKFARDEAKRAKDQAEKDAKELTALQEKAAKERAARQKEIEALYGKIRVEAHKQINKELEKDEEDRLNRVSQSTQEFATDTVTTYQEIWDAVNVLRLLDEKAEKDALRKKLDAQIEYYKNLEELTEEQEELLKELRAQKATETKEQIEEILAVANPIIGQIGSIATALTDGIQQQIDSINSQLDVINTRYTESIENRKALEAQLSDAQGAQRDQILASIEEERKKEQQLAKDRKKLQNEAIKQQNRINQINWANQLVQSIRDTASAVAEALPNIPLSVIAGVLGAVQIGIVASNKPQPIPTFATGGFTSGQGFTDHTGHEVAGVVHANEYVVPANVLSSSDGANLVSILEAMRTNQPGFATGGFTSEAVPDVVPDTSNLSITPDTLVAALEKARLFVAVSEINDVQNRVSVIESRAAA